MRGLESNQSLGEAIPAQEPILLLVVRDAVEDVGLRALGRCQQSTQIDVAGDAAGVRRDARDVIGLPDVGEDLALHVFELVQIAQRRAGSRHKDAPLLG